MILKFGVLDLPYGDAKSYKEVGKKKPQSMGGSLTTGDVAEILEENYSIMEFFWERHGDEIATELADSIDGAAESIAMGAPTTLDPYGEGASKIEAMFHNMLTRREMDGQPGVATQAAKDGVSHRFKRPYKKRPERPSFIDTGLLEGSFRVWLDDNE